MSSMDNHIIQNFSDLATTPLREKGLLIAEAGIEAIKTDLVIKNNFQLTDNILKIKNQTYDLKKFNHIYLLGFGKTSANAAVAINQILGNKITAGIIIDTKTLPISHPNIHILKGTHPKPSIDNLNATEKIISLTQQITKDDLVICIVSGGGSALLCATHEELEHSTLVYEQFVLKGGNISELNTLRKHLSILKGGGLMKLLSPTKVIGLIFSDIPGGQIEDVASGPTFYNKTTLQDLQHIMIKHHIELPPNVNFVETPKDKSLFENVDNILIVSNTQAVEAMIKKSTELGFKTKTYSTELYDKIPEVAKDLNSNLDPNSALINAGEPELVVYTNKLGKGGRNQQLALESIPYLKNNQLFIAIASDGVDNSEAAGAIIDSETIIKANRLELNYTEYKEDVNSFEFFKKLDDLIYTGPTGSNVADLMISIRE